MHSFEYATAKKYAGKKAIVVGAATSGHDVAHDLANHGVGKRTYLCTRCSTHPFSFRCRE